MNMKTSNNIYIKNLIIFSLLIFLILLCSKHEEIYAGSAEKIKLINDKVQKIEKAIEEGLDSLKIEDLSMDEGYLPTLEFYYGFNNDFNNDNLTTNLIALYVTAGHETWLKAYRYYFDEDGRVIKYMEYVPEGQVHKPYHFEIIYDVDGNILSKNIDNPEVQPNKIKMIFEDIITACGKFSKY